MDAAHGLWLLVFDAIAIAFVCRGLIADMRHDRMCRDCAYCRAQAKREGRRED